MAVTSAMHLSLADIARLAQVSRPVASMWRKRELPGRPFPKPVSIASGQPRFDAFEIADYLAATGRGNVPIEREDVAAHATLTGASSLPEAVVVEGITALLTLIAASGEALGELTQPALLALAATVDPKDTLLRREVERLGADLPALASHADALADASFSAPAAVELLLRQQLHRTQPGRAAVSLRPQAQALVGRLARALAADAGWEAPLFVDATDGSGDLLLATITGYAAQPAPSAATVSLDIPSARLVRRRLRVHDIHRVAVTVDAAGDLSITTAGFDGSVHVVQLPTLARPAMSEVEVLDAVGDLLVQLADASRVVVIGPASALTDRPPSTEADRARDAVLRSGRLRATVRLPAGLVVRSPRQHLAMWALGPAHPGVPIADRWTIVGDLSAAPLDDAAVDDVVTDVVASIADSRRVGAHAYRFGRPVATATLITGRASLVTRPARPGRGAAPALTLGEAVAARLCRVIAGNRVRAQDLLATGRRIVGPDELLHTRPLGSRGVDPVTFAATYRASRYTEPGDVVFCTSPRVGAWVDREGGSVVLSPARAVRIAAGGVSGIPPLLPDVLAADLNAAGGATDWRRWPIRLVPRDRQEALSKELERIAAHRADLEATLADLRTRAARAIDDATRPREQGH